MSIGLDPFDLIKRLGDVPLGSLVKVLRDLHHHGTPDSDTLRKLLGSRQSTAETPKPTVPVAIAAPSSDYEAARRHFVQHSQRLREQAILTDKLLDGFAAHADHAKPAILQHELRVQCAPGTTSGARFVVVNCLDRTANVRFRPGRVHSLSIETAEDIHLSFRPCELRLEPEGECEVQLLITLPARDDLPSAFDLGVDVLGNEQVLLKQWVHIEVHPGGGAWRNTTDLNLRFRD